MSFEFLRKTFLVATHPKMICCDTFQTFPYLIFSLFIFHPLSAILRRKRKRSVDNHGSTLFFMILSTISNTPYPMRTDAIHSRLPKVCLLTTIFFAVSPHRL